MSALTQYISPTSGLAADPNLFADSDPPPPHAHAMPDFFPGLIPPLSPTSIPTDQLRTRVEAILNVFDNLHYDPLDIPDWVHRVTTSQPRFFDRKFTVRNLIRAMRDSAAELGLENGERYVLEAVCACANHTVESLAGSDTPLETPAEALARGLQHLANAWVAFLFWPFFAQMEDPENSATGLASPCIGLAFTPKAMAAGDANPDDGSRVFATSYPLREEVLRRDGYKCVISGAWDMWHHISVETFQRIVLDGIWAERCGADHIDTQRKRNSTMLSLELLRRYSQLSDRYIRDMGSGVMDDPANLITLDVCAHSKFDHFGFCFVPTQAPNTYKVKDLCPNVGGLSGSRPPDPLPEMVVFDDHTRGTVDADGHPSPPIGLPNPELMRTHAVLGTVLRMSGAMDSIFVQLVYASVEGDNRPFTTPDGVSFWKDVVGSDEDILDRMVQSFGATYILG